MKKLKSKLIEINLKEISPYKKNSKKHSDAQIDSIKKSIEKYEYIQPIGVDKNKTIVLGHGRYEALKLINPNQKIEVVDLSHLTAKEIKKLRILDNKVVSQEYDTDLLFEEIDSMYDWSDLDSISDDLSIDLKELGSMAPEVKTNGDDDIPENIKSETKIGDLWVLGEHRLLCGDSTKEEDVKKLMNGEKADMVFTDPPYGVEYQSNMRVKTKKFEQIKNDDVVLDIKPIIDGYSSGWCFIWTSWKVLTIWINLFKDFGYPTNQIIWFKGGGVIGDLKKTFSSDYETALVWHRGSELKGKRIGSVWSINKDGATKYIHPTQKPVALPYEAIDKTTSQGYIILDLFLGSGSTLIACEKTKRKCYGMELDTHYCDVIRDRYIEFCIKNEITPKIKKNGKIWKITKSTKKARGPGNMPNFGGEIS